MCTFGLYGISAGAKDPAEDADSAVDAVLGVFVSRDMGVASLREGFEEVTELSIDRRGFGGFDFDGCTAGAECGYSKVLLKVFLEVGDTADNVSSLRLEVELFAHVRRCATSCVSRESRGRFGGEEGL